MCWRCVPRGRERTVGSVERLLDASLLPEKDSNEVAIAAQDGVGPEQKILCYLNEIRFEEIAPLPTKYVTTYLTTYLCGAMGSRAGRPSHTRSGIGFLRGFRGTPGDVTAPT